MLYGAWNLRHVNCIIVVALFLLSFRTWEGLSHDWEHTILQCVQGCKVEQEGEYALPDVLLCGLERFTNDLIDLLIKIKLHPVVINVLTKLIVDLPCVVLSEVHYLIPVGVKAVVGQGRLHLLRVEEVKVCPIEFAFELFNFKLLLQLSLFHCSLIIIHYQLIEIRLFLLPLYLIFSISITSLFVCNQVGLGLLSLLLLLNSVISDSVELYFSDYTLKQKK